MKLSLLFFGVASEDALQGATQLEAVLDASVMADRGGLAAVWLPERHFHAFGVLSPNPAVLAAAIATKTEHIRIRAGSVILPLHDPIRVAEDWSVVDQLSHGRIEIAFGSGWNSRDFVLAPKAYADRRALTLENIGVVQQLWRGGTIERESGSGNLAVVPSLPRPRQPELPTWLTCQSAPTFVESGSRGFGVLTNLNFSGGLNTLAKRIAAYREAFRPVSTWERPNLALMVHTYVGEDERDAETVGRAGLNWYLQANLGLRQSFLDEKRGGEGPQPLDPAEVEELIAAGIGRIVGEGLICSRAAFAQRVERLSQLGIDEIACLVDFVGDPSTMLAGVERLVAAVRELP